MASNKMEVDKPQIEKAEIDKVEKSQEFKDFSLNHEILINELNEDEIVKLFPSLKTVSLTNDLNN